MYGCESWTIQKTERWRTDAFELWCWRTTRCWTTRKSTSPSQRKSVLNIHWKDWCWSWNSNTLVCDVKNWLIWKTLMLGKIEGRRRRGQDRTRWLDGIRPWLNGHGFESTPGAGNGQGGLACCSPWGRKELDTIERLNWTNRVKDTLQISQRKINTFIHSCSFQWQCYTLSGNIKIYALLFICTAWLHSFSLLKTYSGLGLCQKMGCKRKKTEYVFLKSWGSSGNRLNTVKKKKPLKKK